MNYILRKTRIDVIWELEKNESFDSISYKLNIPVNLVKEVAKEEFPSRDFNKPTKKPYSVKWDIYYDTYGTDLPHGIEVTRIKCCKKCGLFKNIDWFDKRQTETEFLLGRHVSMCQDCLPSNPFHLSLDSPLETDKYRNGKHNFEGSYHATIASSELSPLEALIEKEDEEITEKRFRKEVERRILLMKNSESKENLMEKVKTGFRDFFEAEF